MLLCPDKDQLGTPLATAGLCDADLARRTLPPRCHLLRERAPTSPCFRRSPPRSSFVCSMTTGRRRESRCRRSRPSAGTPICRASRPANATGIGCTARGRRNRATGAIPTSCCSIHTRRRSMARGRGTSRCSRITSTSPMTRRTISTAAPTCRSPWSSTTASTGKGTRPRAHRGTRRSSTKRT